MKKVFLLYCILNVSMLFAQEKVAKYNNSFWNENYDIEVTTKNSNELKDLYVGVHSKSNRSACISFSAKNLEKFVTALRQMKEKYVEWSKVANDNNVKEMDKEYGIKFPKVDVCWYGSKWWYAFGINLKFTFRVTKAGECLTICSPKVTASNNQFIDETVYLTFANEDDFDQLINVLDADKLLSGSQAKDNQQNLFK